MSTSIVSRHIEDVIAATTDSGIVNIKRGPSANDEINVIRRSWRRCVVDYGLDPAQRQPARIIESTKLREHQERAERFLRVARGGLEQLYKRVAPLGYVVLLTDSAGVTVDYIGGDTWDRELKRSGLYLGSDWNEKHAGTSAVGTCIVERKPLTCHQVDHFDSTHIGLTCSASPLFDPLGDFMGILDVSALTSPQGRESQHLARHMTVMFAQMIEDANFIRHFNDHWILRLGKDWTLVDVSGEYMLAFDGEGVIRGANSSARRTFDTSASSNSAQSVVGRRLPDVFRTSMDDIWRMAGSVATSDRAALATKEHDLLYAMVIPPRQRLKVLHSSVSEGESVTQPVHTGSMPALDRLGGGDKKMDRLIDQAKRLVNRRVNILLHGETGTGKEVVARALHDSSDRREHPFVAVNCAAIPESLIESELFGYSPGSFTGARNKGRPGLIMQSNRGTLFLDEIGDMPLHLQTRLLRVISEREVVPVGGDRPISVNLTIIAASHRDLRRLIAENAFREDLYYRLCGATLYLPPLRSRTDKEYIINCLLEQEAAISGRNVVLSEDALACLLTYSWPGNIRELRNVICFAIAICDGTTIDVADLPPELGSENTANSDRYHTQPAALGPLDARRAATPEADALITVLRRHHWNITLVARELGICRATVYRHMKRYDVISPTHQ